MSPPQPEFPSPQARDVLISVNPRAGRKGRQRLVGTVATALADQGFRVQILSDLEAVTSLAAELLEKEQLRAVLGAGGDGTMSVLANRLPAQTPLAPLPVGTENLLAKYLQMRDLDQVVQAIAGGAIAHLDAGRLRTAVNSTDPDGPRMEQIFLLMVSCGFDAEVIHRLHSNRAGNITQLSYGKPILHAIRTYEYPELRLYWDPEAAADDLTQSTSSPLTARWAFAFNLPCYAWGLKFTPNASGVDGCFDLCTLQNGSLWQAAKYLLAVLRQRISGLKDCTMTRLKRFRIEADRPVPVQADGEPMGFLPMEVDLLPRRLKLVVPEAWALQAGFGPAAAAGTNGQPSEPDRRMPLSTE